MNFLLGYQRGIKSVNNFNGMRGVALYHIPLLYTSPNVKCLFILHKKKLICVVATCTESIFIMGAGEGEGKLQSMPKYQVNIVSHSPIDCTLAYV